MREPVTITKSGHDRLVLISADEIQRLKQWNRQVFRVSDAPDNIAGAIAATEPPIKAGEVEQNLSKSKF